MTNVTPTFRINPPLSACIRWGLKLMFWVATAATVLAAVKRYLRSQPLPTPWLRLFVTELEVIFGVGLILGVLIFAICRIWAATLKGGELRATTYGGRMVRVPLASVTGAQVGSLQGLPVLVVNSHATKSPLFIYTLGVNINEVYAELASVAGPDHVLTRAFSTSRS